RRQAEMGGQLVWRLDAAVHVLEEKCQAAREDETAEQRQRQIQEGPRGHRAVWPFRRINDTDVARLQLTGDTGFLRPLQEVVIHLATALYLPVENAVLDRLAIHRLRLEFLLIKGSDEAPLLGQCRLVLGAGRLRDVGDLCLQLS